jgi:hypothetical protein
MRPDVPAGVAARLAILRASFVAETDAEARARLERERPRSSESFETAVARRLRELRALDELARHVQRAAR